MAYNVVFEYTNKAKAYEGARTWTSYESEEAFNNNYTPCDKERVLAKGITTKEAKDICSQGTENFVKIAIQEATEPDGTFHPEIAELNLATNLVGKILMAQEQQKKSEEN